MVRLSQFRLLCYREALLLQLWYFLEEIIVSTEEESAVNQDLDLLHHVWPWEQCVCVFVCKSVCLRFPTKWFLLERRQTAIETVVWLSQKRESEREREWEREVDAGVVKLTVPPFTQVLPSLSPEKTRRTSKTQKNKWSHSFRWWSAPDSCS